MRCNEGHCENWCNSASIGIGRHKLYLINLSIILYSFVCGFHWEQLQNFLSRCGVNLVSESTFYRYLKKFVYPIVYDYWLKEQASLINNIKKSDAESGSGSQYAGDGRFDSPGWSAKGSCQQKIAMYYLI